MSISLERNIEMWTIEQTFRPLPYDCARCEGLGCPYAEKCARYATYKYELKLPKEKRPYRTAWIIEPYDAEKGECPEFWDIETRMEG